MSWTWFLALAGGSALGGFLAGRAARSRGDAADAPTPAPWGDGDVLCFPDGADVVLAGERRLLRDDVEIARMYEAETGGVVVLWPPPDARVCLLRALSLEIASPPPTRLELDGAVLDRCGLWTLDGGAHLAEYRGARRSAVALGQRGDTRVWEGTRHAASDVDRLPGAARRSSRG
ncbi:MAG: hypothetical protein IT374_09800 [Polyangiaceae bacterium]|nr:hypothetical protein [Polyangiaceae bacterium]